MNKNEIINEIVESFSEYLFRPIHESIKFLDYESSDIIFVPFDKKKKIDMYVHRVFFEIEEINGFPLNRAIQKRIDFENKTFQMYLSKDHSDLTSDFYYGNPHQQKIPNIVGFAELPFVSCKVNLFRNDEIIYKIEI